MIGLGGRGTPRVNDTPRTAAQEDAHQSRSLRGQHVSFEHPR
jgi:hypothetical protein